MGQQQLLIIVLVLIIVGIAISTGLKLVKSYNQAHERDMIFNQMNVVLGEARKYSARTKSVGGGEGSFIGFSPQQSYLNTERVRIYPTTGETWLLLQGFGTVEGWDGKNPVQVVAQYDKTQEKWTTITEVN